MSSIKPEVLPAIWTLIQVIDAGSLSGAARELGITPSGVSKQLSRLEKQLGARLLQRTTRHVRPTEEGMALYRRCQPLFDALGDAEEAVRSMRTSLSGRLRITATPAFGRALLVPAIGDFADQHPDLSIELVFTAHRMDLVEEGIDLAVREGQLPDSSLIATKLSDTRIVLCASPGYLDRKAAPTELHALSEHDIVSVPVAGPDSDPRRIGLPNGERLDLRPRILVNDLFSVRKLALDGRGIAPLPDYMVERDLADGLLVRLLPEAPMPRLPITALVPERRFQPQRVRVLLDFLVERFRRSAVNS
jgi:DNA-binding transcriptional LysR family regulator